MKIASSIVGAESLQSLLTVGHSGAEMPSISFVESMGMSLAEGVLDTPGSMAGVGGLKTGWKDAHLPAKGGAQLPKDATVPALMRIGSHKIVVASPEAGQDKIGPDVKATAVDSEAAASKPMAAGEPPKNLIVLKRPVPQGGEEPSLEDSGPASDAKAQRPVAMPEVGKDHAGKNARVTDKVAVEVDGKVQQNEISKHKMEKHVVVAKSEKQSVSADAVTIVSATPQVQAMVDGAVPEKANAAVDSLPQANVRGISGTVSRPAQARGIVKQERNDRGSGPAGAGESVATVAGSSKQSVQEAHDGKSPVAIQPVREQDESKVKVPPFEKAHSTQLDVQPGSVSNVIQTHSQPAGTSSAEKSAPVTTAHSAPAQRIAGEGLRSGYTPVEHGTVTATPTTLEVGVPGGTHGWLKVRAELAGDGAVHASVSASSAAGTEMLRRELPTLTSYLHQEQVQVSSVAVHAPQSTMDLSNLASGGGHNQRMSGGSADAQRRETRDERMSATGTQDDLRPGVSHADGERDGLLSAGYGLAGGWLSIRA